MTPGTPRGPASGSFLFLNDIKVGICVVVQFKSTHLEVEMFKWRGARVYIHQPCRPATFTNTIWIRVTLMKFINNFSFVTLFIC